MGEQAPFSVIMCTYEGMDGKRAGELNQSLLSILHQTRPPKELIMVIDGPIDQAQENVLKAFEDTDLPFDFKIIRQEKNEGAAIARDEAVKHATQDWLAIMDSDDISTKDRFEKQAAFLEAHPDTDLLCGAAVHFKTNPKKDLTFVPAEGTYPPKKGLPNTHSSTVMKKSSVVDVGGYSERGLRLSEDMNLWVRLRGEGGNLCSQKDVLSFMRVDDNLMERRRDLAQIKGHWVTAGDMRKYGDISLIQRYSYPLRTLFYYHVTSRFKEFYNAMPESIKTAYRLMKYGTEQTKQFNEAQQAIHSGQISETLIAPEVIANQLPEPRAEVAQAWRHGDVKAQQEATLREWLPEPDELAN